MDRRRRKKIVQPPHSLCQLRFGQYPPTAKTAQPISLGQTAGDHEVLSIVKRARHRRMMQAFQINLVDQNPRAHFTGQIADLAQTLFAGQRARRVMHICNHNQSSLRSKVAGHFSGVERIVVFKAPLKTANLRAKIECGVEQQPIGRLLDQDLLTGRKECRHGQMIGHRGPSRVHHRFRLDPLQLGNCFNRGS